MGSMIVAAIGAQDAALPQLPAQLLENLAVLRRRAGRRVLLVDADARHACSAWVRARAGARLRHCPDLLALDGFGLGACIEREASHYDDLLIVAGASEGQAWRPALIAARLALVPLSAADADCAHKYQLAARLNTARMFNPGLRVLFVPVGDALGARELDAIRAYAHEVMAAQLSVTALDPDALAAPDGRCACDRADGPARAALAALQAEIAGDAPRTHLPARRFGRLALG